jgi:predicted nucleic acid-binding protein
MTYLIDTCILSKLRKLKTKPDPILEKWMNIQNEHHFYLSALTLGEIQQGISKLQDEHIKRSLEEWLYGHLILRFENRILPIDQSVCLKWGELSGNYQKSGITLPIADTLIAATGIIHNLIIVTENIRDFSKIKEAKIFSPWE